MPEWPFRLLRPGALAGALLALGLGASAAGLDAGLVAHWPLDGNGLDISGNENHFRIVGTAGPCPDRLGRLNSAISLPKGVYLESTNPAPFYLQTMTWSIWLKRSDDPDSTTVLYIDDVSPAHCTGIGLYADIAKTAFNVGDCANLATAGPIPANEWVHLVGSYDGASIRLYTNGLLAASAPFAGPIPYSGSPMLELGYNHVWPDTSFDGCLDDLRVYDRALSDAEVLRLYSEIPGLVAHYPLDGDGHAAAGPVEDAEVIGDASVVPDHSGAADGAVCLAPAAHLLVADATPFYLQTMTWSIWVKRTDAADSTTVLYIDDTSPGHCTGIGLYADIAKTAFNVGDCINVATAGPIPAGEWVHLVGTYDGATIRLYTNGMLAATAPFSGPVPYSGTPSPPLEIGYNHVWPDTSFDGCVDELRVYNRALSGAEILRLYLDMEGLVAYYPLDGDGTDLGGHAFHAMPSGSPAVCPDRFAMADHAVALTQPDYYIVTDATPFQLQTMTWSVWVKRTDDPDSATVLYMDDNFPDHCTGIGFYANIVKTAFNAGDCVNQAEAGPIPAGEWVHLVGTYDGTTIRLYTNGVLAASTNFAGPISYSGAQTLEIGYNHVHPNTSFAGCVDELRVYNRALSGEEVQRLFQFYPYTIQTLPEQQIGYWGKSASFTVPAGTADTATYQWFKDGLPLAGETNPTLVLHDLALADSGHYAVRVSTTFGSVLGAPATLTVLPAAVSVHRYAGVTIDGVVGRTYWIQYITELQETNNWTTLETLTLTQPVQVWIDMDSPGQPRRFYRVMPGE